MILLLNTLCTTLAGHKDKMFPATQGVCDILYIDTTSTLTLPEILEFSEPLEIADIT